MTAFVDGQRPSIPADGRDNRPPTAVVASDERLEQLLNRAGQTISDLPRSDGKHLTYDREQRSGAEHEVFAFAHQTGYVDVIDCLAMHQDYIMHLTDVIDRMEWALENQVTFNERMHRALANADIPEGMTFKQFAAVASNIVDALRKEQEGWDSLDCDYREDLEGNT